MEFAAVKSELTGYKNKYQDRPSASRHFLPSLVLVCIIMTHKKKDFLPTASS